MKGIQPNLIREVRFAKCLPGNPNRNALKSLKALLRQTRLSVIEGDVVYIDNAGT
jgi:hypothetical protein